MADKVRLRSPYYIQVNDQSGTSALQTVTLVLSSVEGSITLIDIPQNVRYTLTKDVAGTDGYVLFEVSELFRDYVNTDFDGTYNNEPIWIKVKATGVDSVGSAVSIDINGGTASTTPSLTGLGFDGYSFYKDGANHLISSDTEALTTATELRIPEGEIINVGVNVDGNTNGYASFWSGGVEVSTRVTFSPGTDSSTYLKYVANDTDSSDEFRVYDFNDVLQQSIPVIEVPCKKYGFCKLTFYNLYGALQDLFFFGKQIEKLRTTENKFKANAYNTSTNSYSTSEHQHKVFNKQGEKTISISTSYVGEDYTTIIQDVVLSQRVWLTIDSVVYPVNVKNVEQVLKTHLNDSLVAYTLELEYAFDEIQNIR